MQGLEVREIKTHEDHRGWLAEIIRADETSLKPLMTYISMTRSGIIRGPHEHKEQTDYFCFLGKFRLYFWDNRKDSVSYRDQITVDTSDAPTIAIVPPGIVHAYKNISDANAFVLNLADRLYKGWGRSEDVDEIRYENDLSSPFRINE